MVGQYILDENHNPVPEPDVLKWGRWLEKGDRDHQQTFYDGTEIRVSTIFLGLDHSFGMGGPPVLWETMIFDTKERELDKYQNRYTTREEAIEGHKQACLLVQEMLNREDK